MLESFIGATAKRVCLAILSNGQGNQVAQNEVFKRQCIDTYTEDDIDELLLLGAFCNTLDTDIVKCCKFIFGSVSNMSPIKKIIYEDQFYTTLDFDSVIYGMGLVYSPATSIEKNSKHTIIQPFYSDIVGFSARYCLARGFVDWLYSSPNRQTRLTKELCNTMHNLSIAVHKTEIEFPQDAAYAAVRKLFIETTDEKDDDEDQDIGVEAAVISCSDFPITQFLLSTYNKADNEKIMKFLRQVFGAF